MQTLIVHTRNGTFNYSPDNRHTSFFTRDVVERGVVEVVEDWQEGDGSPGLGTVVATFPLDEVLGTTESTR